MWDKGKENRGKRICFSTSRWVWTSQIRTLWSNDPDANRLLNLQNWAAYTGPVWPCQVPIIYHQYGIPHAPPPHSELDLPFPLLPMVNWIGVECSGNALIIPLNQNLDTNWLNKPFELSFHVSHKEKNCVKMIMGQQMNLEIKRVIKLTTVRLAFWLWASNSWKSQTHHDHGDVLWYAKCSSSSCSN